jgi:hypothetical protein
MFANSFYSESKKGGKFENWTLSQRRKDDFMVNVSHL